MYNIVVYTNEGVEHFSMIDKEAFWVKINLPKNRFGFLPAKLEIDEADRIFLLVPRPGKPKLLNLFTPPPLAVGTLISLAYQRDQIFELWSAEIKDFIETTDQELDKYELIGLNQEMNQSERIKERSRVSVPLKLKAKYRTYYFSGCELSEEGVSLWLPQYCKKHLQVNETYTLSFEPTEVEPFHFMVQLARPHTEDVYSHGFTAGFSFINPEPDSLSVVRIKQLKEARGQLNSEFDLSKAGHYLQNYWEGEYFE